MAVRTGKRRLNRAQVGILLTALALHLLLLLVPLQEAIKATETAATVEVRLAPAPVPQTPVPERRTAVVRPEPLPAPPSPSEPLAEPESPLENASAPLTVAHLLRQAEEMDWKEKPAPQRSIARAVDSKLYASLSQPVLELEVNLFNDHVLPTKVEIVDRWLEPGGTHKVVIRTPTGDTLCGRKEPIDPFRPWLQMPMMFYSCGGGGKRQRKELWRGEINR